MSRKTVLKMLLVAGCLLLAYWVSTYFFAYTDDAWLTTDILRIAPRVAGHVQSVEVKDNQRVKVGQVLARIDPAPFIMRVRAAEAELEQARAKYHLQQSTLQAARDELDQTGSALDLASAEEKRFRELLSAKAISQQAYDVKNDSMREARDRHKATGSQVDMASQSVKAHALEVAALEAALDLAEYNANHTVMAAPVNGFITALDIKPGDWAQIGEPIMAVVSDQDWRVLANYREQLVRHIRPGARVVVYLDNYPWHLFEGVVQGVAHGVSRDPVEEKLLPYVEPKTDWIRLSRRFPVRVEFKDGPPDLRLLSGSDARTVVFY